MSGISLIKGLETLAANQSAEKPGHNFCEPLHIKTTMASMINYWRYSLPHYNVYKPEFSITTLFLSQAIIATFFIFLSESI